MTDPPEVSNPSTRLRHRMLVVILVVVVASVAMVVVLSLRRGADPVPPAPSPENPVVEAGGTPAIETSELAPDGIAADLEAILQSVTTGLETEGAARLDMEAVARLAGSGDQRAAWVLADLMRFFPPDGSGLSTAFTDLTGLELSGNPWKEATETLIRQDIPAPMGFAEWKGRLYTIIEPGWAPFFSDQESLIDWRYVTWGGVRIDDRPISETDRPCPRGCIPALNDPPLEPASENDYYPDDKPVFAVVVNGEAVAFPKNMMEIHEMVNITVGGRRLGIPYCTLCGSAQAYFTDQVPESVRAQMGDASAFELRTSGLLTRSNKMMYEFHTRSMIDTFTGQAVSGPLREAGVHLQQTTVIASGWGEWKEANPHTYIVVEDGGLGRSYPEDLLRGRDDQGPIFPIGNADDALPVHEKVLGVVRQDASNPMAVAFPVVTARRILDGGGSVGHEGITVIRDGGGLRAVGPDGQEIPSHEAFWFAWSQFYPDTVLWEPPA